jgi:hypothetical protein
MIPAGLAAFVKFVGHAPWWVAVLVFVLGAIILFVIWMLAVYFFLRIGKQNGASSSDSDLEIEPIPSEKFPAKKHSFHIRVSNSNPKLNADDLKVEIVSFTDNLSAQFQSVAQRYYHPSHFDKVAELKSATGRDTINPNDGLEFTVFYFEPSMKIQGQPRSVVAKFNVNESYGKENTASFHEGKKYKIKFAASARGFSRIEREFNMEFFNDDGICKIALTPLVPPTKEEKKAEILKRLGQYREKLNDLYSKISRMEFWDYANQNEHFFKLKAFDPESQMLIVEIENFLDKEIPGAAADIKDTVNMQFSPIRISPNELGGEKRKYYILALDHLKHLSNQLVKIKDNFNQQPL